MTIQEIIEYIKKLKTDNTQYEWDIYEILSDLEDLKTGIENGDVWDEETR